MLKSLRKNYRNLNRILVSEAALLNNLSWYRGQLPGKAICPVLKSNAYGHGLTLVGKLLDSSQPPFLVVDSLYEAYELQKAGVKSPILILGYTFPENLRPKMPFHFTVSDLAMAERLAELKLPAHLEVDTGFARMGFAMDELESALAAMHAMNLQITGCFTHLSNADCPDNRYTEQQCQRFARALAQTRAAGFDPEWIHVGSSSGSLKVPLPEVNMVRLGLSLYGLSSYDDDDPKRAAHDALQPALRLHSTVIAVRQLQPGDKVSYGCTFEAPRPMRIAVLPVGYYEGIPRALSNTGCVQIAGHTCPIVGRVCMNHVMVDIGQQNVSIGDDALIYSNQKKAPNTVDTLAKQAGTIPYELLVNLAQSTKRVAAP